MKITTKINLFDKELEFKGDIFLAIVLAFSLLFGVLGYLIGINQDDVVIEDSTFYSEPTNSADEDLKQQEPEKNEYEDEIKVNVVGCVKNPGIVTIKRGQIIEDAVICAGGYTEDADVDNINRVYELNENVTLRIRSKSDPPLEAEPVHDESFPGMEITSSDLGAVISSSGLEQSEVININTASIEKLKTLPYINEEIAQNIIEYRKANGGFKNTEEIMNVKGIKQGIYEKIKTSIKV